MIAPQETLIVQKIVFVRCARCGALFVPHEDQAATLREARVACPHCLAIVIIHLPDALPPK